MEKYVFCLMVCACLAYTANGDTASSVPNQLWNSTWVDLLKKDLLTNYDKFARPTQHYNVTNIDIKLTITHIDIDEVKSVLTVHGWMKMEWNDDKIKWNSADYGGVDSVRIAPHELWKPDLVLYNSAAGLDIVHYGQTNMIMYNTGKILWVPPTEFHALCELNMILWPFDEQICKLVIGSWTYDGYKMNLTSQGDDSIVSRFIVENHEWRLKNMTTDRNTRFYECCTEPYVDIQYNLTLTRRSPMFKSVVVSPATVIILLTLASFWLPPNAGEKIVLNGVIALIICLLLMYFAEQLPVMAGSTPLIVLFYSSSLYLIGFSTIISIIVLNLSRSQHSYDIPRFLKKLLNGCTGTVLGLKHLQSQPHKSEEAGTEVHASSDNIHVNGNSNSKPSLQQDWYLLAVGIDRLAFVVYCVVFIILAVSYSL